ncbi:glycosyltransferase family 2 protein [Bifidobacterium xylocopae]|nr:glycosyltransferase family 2 protein [Bifidobacterium xylocopae]
MEEAEVMRISVVMATYNGEKYLKEQIYSILSNLRIQDELIIADDGSKDQTQSIVLEIAESDCRVRLLRDHSHKGVIRNFSYGLTCSKGEIIYLADQDDIWLKTKVSEVMEIFKEHPEVSCILHDVAIVDKNLQIVEPSFFHLRGSQAGFVRNILKNSYMGNAMAFRRNMLTKILPIPYSVPMHDQWIGLINDRYGKVLLYPQVLGLYRRHDDNVTELTHGSIKDMLKKRIQLLQCLFSRSRF